MVPIGSTSFTVPGPAPVLAGPEAGPIVVWLRGEHDCSTDDALSLELACAIALNDADLVVDLSEVSFISASTLGVIVRAREFLRARSRSLALRSPSACARRVIEACGLGGLVAPGPQGTGGLTGEALGSWVEVPAAERPGGQQRQPTPAPAPAQLARARALSAHPAGTTGRAGAP